MRIQVPVMITKQISTHGLKWKINQQEQQGDRERLTGPKDLHFNFNRSRNRKISITVIQND